MAKTALIWARQLTAAAVWKQVIRAQSAWAACDATCTITVHGADYVWQC